MGRSEEEAEMKIKSKNFILRPKKKSDFNSFYKNINDKLICKNMFSPNYPVSLKEAKKEFNEIKGYGKIIPPCPVIHKRLVLPSFSKELLKEFQKFESKNKNAGYFLLDGSHKITAAALTNNEINVFLIKKDKDISDIKKLLEKGELFSLSIENTIKKNIEELKKHFTKRKGFQTVEDKTKRMVNKKVIPKYMINYCQTHNKKINYNHYLGYNNLYKGYFIILLYGRLNTIP